MIYLLCNNKFINYGSQGLVALMEHIGTKTHIGSCVIEKTNYSLPNASLEVVHHPYGIHPDYRNFVIETPVPVPRVSIHGRALNQEALILFYVTERNLPFSSAGKVVDITKELSKDHKALHHISLSKTTAAYKL